MTVSYSSWPETRLVRSKTLAGSAAVNYEPSLVAMHAVAIEDEVPASSTVCGKLVRDDLERAFNLFPPTIQCARCAEAVGEDNR